MGIFCVAIELKRLNLDLSFLSRLQKIVLPTIRAIDADLPSFIFLSVVSNCFQRLTGKANVN